MFNELIKNFEDFYKSEGKQDGDLPWSQITEGDTPDDGALRAMILKKVGYNEDVTFQGRPWWQVLEVIKGKSYRGNDATKEKNFIKSLIENEK